MRGWRRASPWSHRATLSRVAQRGDAGSSSGSCSGSCYNSSAEGGTDDDDEEEEEEGTRVSDLVPPVTRRAEYEMDWTEPEKPPHIDAGFEVINWGVRLPRGHHPSRTPASAAPCPRVATFSAPPRAQRMRSDRNEDHAT